MSPIGFVRPTVTAESLSRNWREQHSNRSRSRNAFPHIQTDIARAVVKGAQLSLEAGDINQDVIRINDVVPPRATDNARLEQNGTTLHSKARYANFM